jgi:hypothetical protein
LKEKNKIRGLTLPNFRTYYKAGMLAHTCNSSTWEAEAEDPKFNTSLGYTVREKNKTTTTTKKHLTMKLRYSRQCDID